MTAPLTAVNEWSAWIRKGHKATQYPTHCDACSERWPCDQIEIADELDRLTAEIEQARVTISALETALEAVQS